MNSPVLKVLSGSALILGISLFTFSCNKNPFTAPKSDTTVVVRPRVPVGYTLVWADEFNGTGVDTTKWNLSHGNPGVNNEKEFYQAANATVAGGNLIITAKHDSMGGQPYTSAKLDTYGKFSMTYGRIEARIQLPQFTGSWPAFWMLGTNINTVGWPNCGETDIMEHVNATNLIYATIHWNSGGGAAQYGLNTPTTPQNFHVYAVNWTKDSLMFYVDSTLYMTANIHNNVNNTGAFQNPFYMILNLAVAGDFPGQTVDNTALPMSMLVDYVRVYAIKP